MRSTQLISDFATSFVADRLKVGDAGVIVARQAKRWGFPEDVNTVVFTGMQARGAHMTPSSPAGRLIIEMLSY